MVIFESHPGLNGENEPRFYSVPAGEYFFWRHDPYFKISPTEAVGVMCVNEHGSPKWKGGGTVRRLSMVPVAFEDSCRVRKAVLSKIVSY